MSEVASSYWKKYDLLDADMSIYDSLKIFQLYLEHVGWSEIAFEQQHETSSGMQMNQLLFLLLTFASMVIISLPAQWQKVV